MRSTRQFVCRLTWGGRRYSHFRRWCNHAIGNYKHVQLLRTPPTRIVDLWREPVVCRLAHLVPVLGEAAEKGSDQLLPVELKVVRRDLRRPVGSHAWCSAYIPWSEGLTFGMISWQRACDSNNDGVYDENDAGWEG